MYILNKEMVFKFFIIGKKT